MKLIHIYYASTAGNTYIVVSYLRDLLISKWYCVELYCVMNNQKILPACAYIFASGTYGHGLLQEHMEKFIYKYNKSIDLQNTACWIIGLWDDKYDAQYNVESANLLSEFVDSHNGKMTWESLKIIKSPLPHLHWRVDTWIQNFLEKI